MNDHKNELLRLVAKRATRGIDQLPPNERADVYEGVSLILTGDEAAAAKLAAFSIRESERHQLQFQEILRQAK